MMNYNKERWEDYKAYHIRMLKMGDCDPAYPALRYIADRFDLNLEQRYWLAWLYACCYCVPTAYYILNEFPDYENVDSRRLQWWWSNNKSKLLFQTDRLKVKSFNKFVAMFESYKEIMGSSQHAAIIKLCFYDKEGSYKNVYEFTSELYYFGRYSLFLYLEALHELTGLPIEPTGLDLRNAESCRNGLCYAMGKDEWVRKLLTGADYQLLDLALLQLYNELRLENPEMRITYWNIETSLCAYKKLYWKKRYLGYYIDRQAEEISKMETAGCEGVDWSPLWDFRNEYFHNSHLFPKVRKWQMGKWKKDEIEVSEHKNYFIKKGDSYGNNSSK